MRVLFVGAALIAAAFAAKVTPENDSLVVHEWGTFTSVAGADGEAVQWAPLTDTPDLPCFVERLTPQYPKAAWATVRMETPVLYFYPQHAMTLSVHIGFPKGWITEWYPRATQVVPKPSTQPLILDYRDGQISWDGIRVTPGSDGQFPTGKGASRYYAARHTDASQIDVNGQREKMIFYRGIANFSIPLRAKFDGKGMVEVRNTGGERIPMAMILFENRGGRMGYRLVHDAGETIRISPPELTGNGDEVKSSLWDVLVKSGLFPKEASAMIETWHDSWFEEGTRLMYIVTQQMVNTVLPLSVSPAPTAVERVFVGRIEMLSPAVRAEMEAAIASNQSEKLAPYGRFLEPFIAQIRPSAAAVTVISKARMKFWQNFAGGCVQ